MKGLDLVVFGLSLSSSWGNGHATTYRALLKAFAARGHRISFFECDRPWYATHRDLPQPDFCNLEFYDGLDDLHRFEEKAARADAVMVGSFVPDGSAVGRFVQEHARGVTAFYDIDTPVTLARLARRACDYLDPALIPKYDLYLSFTGGPTLDVLKKDYLAPAPRLLHCSVDADVYRPVASEQAYDLGYLGTYSPDRQPALERLLMEPARRAPHLSFIVAGAQFPCDIDWPANVRHVDHVAPANHPAFYNSCRFALNVTRADMVRAGFSPSVRMFEAAACGVPVVSDYWRGLEDIFDPSTEIAVASDAEDILALLQETPERERRAMAARARTRVLAEHTAAIRASELEAYIREAAAARVARAPRRAVA
jgi:spore maturation protein CgeB